MNEIAQIEDVKRLKQLLNLDDRQLIESGLVTLSATGNDSLKTIELLVARRCMAVDSNGYAYLTQLGIDLEQALTSIQLKRDNHERTDTK
ncbi:hypothetical protein BegalDRAFT_0935 [Beggiatoa alba B18LD]|uniref:Uncharacterized protein n=1 Tax=Beggiatoa alba B18LD TaxID=395493 RepID=I3CDZ9_9GAMM|nr:hypothetical protein [Beggiatoa alba]EIJ41842.1 hypothetical protein BegalDRAFT_0935 [Beggiatoa alba B18LD]